MAKRIGILTGGGDVPGLNPCIKAVVERAADAGTEVLGIRRGWAGLLYLDPKDDQSRREYLQPLDKAAVRTVSRMGGTFLHTSRVQPSAVKPEEMPEHLAPGDHPVDGGKHDVTASILGNIEALGLDALVTIERTMHSLSTIRAVCGRSSLIHVPPLSLS